jgi:uncharacterized protein YjaZ
MSQTSRDFLNKNFPAFFEYEILDDALMALDDFIIMEGLDENDNMTDFGHEAQAVYDEIYMCNE